MANLTIKNIPENLYQKLKKSAEVNRRSINAEAIFCLEQLLEQLEEDAETVLHRIRTIRAKSVRHLLTDEEILRLKNEGHS